MTLGAEAEERAFEEWLAAMYRVEHGFPGDEMVKRLRDAFAAGVRYGLELRQRQLEEAVRKNIEGEPHDD